MGIGRGKGEHRNEVAVKEAIGNPLTETMIQNAKGVIVNIAEVEKPLDEINAIMTVIGDRVDNPEANIIFGTIIDDSLQDEIIITVIATGIGM